MYTLIRLDRYPDDDEDQTEYAIECSSYRELCDRYEDGDKVFINVDSDFMSRLIADSSNRRQILKKQKEDRKKIDEMNLERTHQINALKNRMEGKKNKIVGLKDRSRRLQSEISQDMLDKVSQLEIDNSNPALLERLKMILLTRYVNVGELVSKSEKLEAEVVQMMLEIEKLEKNVIPYPKENMS